MVCQISGPPEDLAAALSGFVQNAIEARLRVAVWDHERLRENANNARRNGFEVEMSAAPPIALICVYAEVHNLIIKIIDGGLGIPEPLALELFAGHLLGLGPSEKEGGGHGIKQSWLVIKSRYQGQIFGGKSAGWEFFIPTIPWAQRTRKH
jgi:signal transduction histidine kinase